MISRLRLGIGHRFSAASPSRLRERLRQTGRDGIERFISTWPRTHMALVSALGGLGLIYLLVFPVTGLVLLSGLPGRWASAGHAADWVMFAIVAVVAAGALLVTWQLAGMRFRLPGGEVLDRSREPALFEAVEELSSILATPAIHRLVLTDRFQVEMIRTPRWGYPLCFTNTLLIGLPALLCLTPDQLRVLIARRLGQLRIRDGLPGNWIHALRHLWPRYLDDSTECRAPLSWLLRGFFTWYVPLFHRLSRAAARQAELDADAYALQVIDDQTVAEALVAACVSRRYLADDFWPAVLPAAPGIPRPREFPFALMAGAVKSLSPEQSRMWLERVLASDSAREMEQPALRVRLDAIGHGTPHAPAPLKEAASDRYLGPALTEQIKRMDSVWLRDVMPAWNERYALRQRHLQRLRSLAARARTGRLGVREASGYAALAGRLLPAAGADAVYRQILSMELPDAQLHLRIGRCLLARGDPQGVTALERAASLDQGCAVPVARLLARYFREKGQPEAASRYLKQALVARVS